MEFDASQPIWRQLVSEFHRRILSGQWAPGMRLPSTRELALEFRVNPNTVQRALTELDRAGNTRTERTSGRFVVGSSSALSQLRDASAEEIVDRAISQLRGLGVSQKEAIDLTKKRWTQDD
jgi:GntR family transcriptional regulator